MARYRKKPVVIEAEQFLPDQKPWPAGVVPKTTLELRRFEGRADEYEHVIATLEGPLMVVSGDWIITGVQGEKYPCKPDIFEATYEKVEEE